MKKFSVMLLIIFMLFSCKELKRNNPYDPSAANYAGITYKGEIWYPDNTEIKSMIIDKGIPLLAAFKQDGPGYCIMKLLSNSNAHIIGSTGSLPGTFTSISDLCADSSGNIYIVDSKPFVQIMDGNENFTWCAITYTAGIDKLFIEYNNSYIYITNTLDRKIYKYQTDGVYIDSKILSLTAYGEFASGRIFKLSDYIFVINEIRKNEILKLDGNLNLIDDIIFKYEILDGVDADGVIQLLSEKAVFKVDEKLNILLKWGDFGDGPGRILNGKLIAYNNINKYIYILDGISLKMFGE